jgi:hypothetical protein
MFRKKSIGKNYYYFQQEYYFEIIFLFLGYDKVGRKDGTLLSGPSLKKQDAHSSIHEASLNEAKELNKLFRMCIKKGENEKAFQVAEVIIEHWESRTLKHAEAEEEGLYVEMIEENPPIQHLVIQLTRDHDLMRRIVEHLKVLLTNN